MNWHAQVLARGALKLGAHPFAPPIAINSVERDGRPACISCGWCGSGCPTEAKATAANTYLAKAEQLGARVISEAFVHRVNYDSAKNRVTGVEYLDAQRREHRIEAKVVVLAAHAIETPRLLLLSAHRAFPEGLANSSGLVGKNFMSHPTWQVFGTFDEPVNAFKGMQMGHVMVQDYYRPDSRNGYARGFILLSYMMTPITFGNLSGLMFGQELKDFLHEYTHTAAWWAHAEGLPDERNSDHARSGAARRARPACRARHLPMGRQRCEARGRRPRQSCGNDGGIRCAKSSHRPELRGTCDGFVPHGARPKDVCGERVLPDARRAQSLHLRYERVRDKRGRQSHAHGDGHRRSRGGAHSRRRPARGRGSDMNEPSITLGDIGALAALADGIIPADERDAGAGLVHAGPSIAERMRRSPSAHVYVEGLRAARVFASERFGQDVRELNASQMRELLAALRDQSPAFFRQLRADVCALYLSDAGVWQRIGFPGPSSQSGGYPDFDQPQG